MDISLSEKVALITGGSRGIGLAIAKSYADAGAQVMITSRKEDALREATAFIGGGASYIAGNAGDTEFAQKCVSATLEQFGKIDIFVNNAATNPYSGPTLEVSESQFDKTFQVNLRGPLFWCSQVWSQHMKNNPGVIINIASVGGLRAEGSLGVYNLTKAALELGIGASKCSFRIYSQVSGNISHCKEKVAKFLGLFGIRRSAEHGVMLDRADNPLRHLRPIERDPQCLARAAGEQYLAIPIQCRRDTLTRLFKRRARCPASRSCC